MGDRPFKLLVHSGSEQESPVVTLKLQYDETSTKSTTYGSYLSDDSEGITFSIGANTGIYIITAQQVVIYDSDTAYEITWCCTCTNQINAADVGYTFTE